MPTFPRTELQELFQQLTEQPVIWRNSSMPFIGQRNGQPGWWTELMIITSVGKGTDEYRQEYNPDPAVNCLRTELCGYRIMTLQVSVKSNSNDIWSIDILEDLRLRLRSLTTKQAFQEAGIALIDIGPSKDLPVARDKMTTTESTFDVRLGWATSIDPGDDGGGWIETVDTITDNLTS